MADTFDSVAASYDDARPDYPDELIDAVVDLTGIRPDARLLEVGCGTGKATRPFVARGYHVVAVEPGERLADEARHRVPGATVHTARFEDWAGDGTPFELVYAATSWHWLDLAARWRQAHRLLRPDGHVAVWSARHGFPPDADPFFAEMQEVYDRLGHGDREPVAEQPAPADLFEPVATRSFTWALDYTAEEYIALLDTFSDHIAMPAPDRAVLDAEIRARLRDRRVRRHWVAVLHVTRRVGG